MHVFSNNVTYFIVDMAMPDEASSAGLFKHNLKSFIINIYGKPKKMSASSVSSLPASIPSAMTRPLSHTAGSIPVTTAPTNWLVDKQICVNVGYFFLSAKKMSQ